MVVELIALFVVVLFVGSILLVYVLDLTPYLKEEFHEFIKRHWKLFIAEVRYHADISKYPLEDTQWRDAAGYYYTVIFSQGFHNNTVVEFLTSAPYWNLSRVALTLREWQDAKAKYKIYKVGEIH